MAAANLVISLPYHGSRRSTHGCHTADEPSARVEFTLFSLWGPSSERERHPGISYPALPVYQDSMKTCLFSAGCNPSGELGIWAKNHGEHGKSSKMRLLSQENLDLDLIFFGATFVAAVLVSCKGTAKHKKVLRYRSGPAQKLIAHAYLFQWDRSRWIDTTSSPSRHHPIL